MTTLEIKNKLISRIQATENQDLLEEIYRLLDIDQDDFGIMNLSKEQREAVLKGEEDIDNGDFLTDEQADKDMDQWLKK